jgi:capsular polysaccharide biosynthesis protein
MEPEYSILKHFQELLKFWWVVGLIAIAGGVFGYEISQIRTPVYESRGVFTVGLDFVKAGLMTDAEEDQAINNVADVIGSTATLEQVVSTLQAKDLSLTLDDLKKFASTDRQGFQIAIHVDHTNSQTAFDIADTWMTIAYQDLQAAIQQAVRASALNRQLSDLETCLQQVTATVPAFPPCEIMDQTSLMHSLNEVEIDLLDANAKSKGIISAISVALTEKPQVPISPRVFNRNILTAGGAVMGFLAGVLLVEGGFIGKWSKGNAKSS